MKYLLLVLILGGCDAQAKCPAPHYVGTQDPLTEYEQWVSNATKLKCGMVYRACLTKLTRTGHRSWHAICGDHTNWEVNDE